MSLLSLCQDAARLVGEPQMSHVVNNKDVSVARFLAYARLEGMRLARAYPWQVLVREASFTTLAQEDQGPLAAIAGDLDRLVNASLHNRSRGARLFGPMEETRWQRLKAGGVAGSVGGGFRLRGGRLLLLPAPAAGDVIAFEYVSSHWVDRTGDGQGDGATFTADTDRPLMDRELILLGMVWRWLRQNGFAYEHAHGEYLERLNEALGRDGGKAALVMNGGGVMGAGWSGVSVPDGNFGP